MKKPYFIFVMIAFISISCGEIKEEAKLEDTCVSQPVSYQAHVVPILESNCYRCHAEDKYEDKAYGNTIYSYSLLKEYVDNGLFLGSVTHAPGYIPMPHKGEKIDSCSIAILTAWVEKGAPNN